MPGRFGPLAECRPGMKVMSPLPGLSKVGSVSYPTAGAVG
jgi:hypothetical protein